MKGIVRFDVVGLDLPERAHGQLQRVEVLPIDEHIPAREAVVRNSVGAFVVRRYFRLGAFTGMGSHPGRRSRSEVSVGPSGGTSGPFGSGLGLFSAWGCFWWHGLRFRHGPRFRRGPDLGTAPLQLVRLQRLFDGEPHHHHPRDHHRSHDDLRCRQDADPKSHGSRPRGGDRASSREVVKLDPVMVEGLIAPLRQDGPGLGSLLDDAPPSIPPGQCRRSLEVGEPRVLGLRALLGLALTSHRRKQKAAVRCTLADAWSPSFNPLGRRESSAPHITWSAPGRSRVTSAP